MTQRRNIRREVIACLKAHPDGLTMKAIAKEIKAGYENVRTTMQRSRPAGVYIAEWIQFTRGPLAAVYKVAQLPEDAPHPTRSTASELRDTYENVRAATPLEASKYFANAARERAERHPAQGLTQIRGPWPTHH